MDNEREKAWMNFTNNHATSPAVWRITSFTSKAAVKIYLIKKKLLIATLTLVNLCAGVWAKINVFICINVNKKSNLTINIFELSHLDLIWLQN